jgi:outer membrane lipoprotein-sorting protein
MKLDSVAGQYADQIVGALYIPGTQLLVVTGKTSAHFDPMLKQRAYRDVYIDLNGIPDATKVFISDLGANGLRFKRENNQPYDSVDVAGKTIAFDGNWGKAKISEEEYTKTWQSYDDRYSQLLQALIAQLKKPS